MVYGPDERQRLAQQATQARSSPTPSPVFTRQTLGAPPSSKAADRPAGRLPRHPGVWAGAVAAGVTAAMAAAWLSASPAQGDTGLTSAQEAARQAAFQAAGPLTFPVVPANERPQAIAATGLPADQQAILIRDLTRPDSALVYVTLWDDMQEDGDVVTLASSGFSQTVPLRHAPQRFAVPVSGGEITVHGIHDGGGGITLAVQAAGGPVVAPVLRPGQSLTIPVAVP